MWRYRDSTGRRRLGVLFSLAGVIAGGIIVLATVLVPSAQDGATAATTGPACLTWREPHSGVHKLSTVDPATGARVTVAELPYRVNAVGYATDQNLLYGLTPPTLTHWRPRVVSIAMDGRVTELGEPRGLDRPLPGLAGAYVGTVMGDLLVIRGIKDLVTVNIDPESPEFLAVQDVVDIDVAPHFGDWVADPETGLLHALSSDGPGGIVTVDPRTGETETTKVPGLAGTGFFGAVFLTPERVLYGVSNSTKGRAALYRVPLDDPEAVVVGTWPRLKSADAAYCRPPAPPPEQPTPPASSSSASPSPEPSASEPEPSPPPATRPPPPPPPLPDELRVPVPEQGTDATEVFKDPKKRRFVAVGVVLMAISGSAGARAAAKKGR